MQALLDEYDYLTLTLIRGTLSQVEDEFTRFLEDLKDRPSAGYAYWHAPFDPKLVYFPEPQGGAAIPVVCAFWEPSTTKDIVAFMANLSDGWIRLISFYCRRFPREVLSIQTALPDRRWPRNDFHYFQGGEQIRHVAAWKDDPGWQFYVQGKPQSFEDVGHYEKRRVRDRLNRHIITEYARRFGADMMEKCFWTSPKHAFWFKECRSAEKLSGG